MSGFDADWLDLREPADHRSLAEAPLRRLAARFAGPEEASIVDLGAGSGSLLRALAPRLGRRQRWTLVDADNALLAHARTRLTRWSDAWEERGTSLALRKGDAEIEVATLRHDLAADPLPAEAAAADLVTASAFFDLVGHDWMREFLARLAEAGRPLYAPLVYAGRKSFAPDHPLDGAALAAFNRHQLRDKGFGPALGPGAPEALERLGGASGFACMTQASPWTLGAGDAPLARRLARDMAGAIAELDDAPALGGWLALRLETATQGVEVAHTDVLLER